METLVELGVHTPVDMVGLHQRLENPEDMDAEMVVVVPPIMVVVRVLEVSLEAVVEEAVGLLKMVVLVDGVK